MQNPTSNDPLRFAVVVASVAAVLSAFPLSVPASAESNADTREQSMRFFESRIRPILIDRCYECHSGEDNEGGLRLDQHDSISVGGDSGPAAIAGDPDASLLMGAIRYDGLEMPPDQPLSEAEQADFATWIRQGAFWPIAKTASSLSSGSEETERASDQGWASQPLATGPSPDPVPGIRSPTAIDRYIDVRLHSAGLHRAPTADRVRLIRRLSYDLLGVPPSPESIDRFVADRRPNAYVRLVDSMFADPAYGTRMARLWLDLVRYAESDGWRADAYRPQAWRYRDFVASAFNDKMPYDEFVSLQIAGDEISPSDDRALAAVGFLRLGIFEYNQRDAEGQWQNIVDEMTDVTADVFLATGLACAKCHDHKFDPIPRSDYFRLRSVFEPVVFVDRAMPTSVPTTEDEVDDLLAELKTVDGDEVRKMRDAHAKRFPADVVSAYRKSPSERNSYEHQLAYLVTRQVFEEGLQDGKVKGAIGPERFKRRGEILRRLSELGANPYTLDAMISVADAVGPIRPTRLPGRSQGSEFQPGVPEWFGGQDLQPTPPMDSPQSSGRRSALAAWITSPDNPVTARVMVNRLWQYHFGQGIVRSPNDFGSLGEKPTHPELLDHLANQFIESGWSIQSIQREIVSSAAYKQSAVHPDAESALELDAGNRLIWHHPVRRLDAEQYRDSLLIAMNSLIDEVGGPGPSGTQGRRSIYLRRFRNKSDEMLATLDAPPGVVGTARRDVTTTAPQSLMMMNNPRILSVAKSFSARVRKDVQETAPEQRSDAFIERAHRILTGLDPDDQVRNWLLPLVESGKEGETDACHVLLNSNAFLFVE
ncbi:MAG: PSD1 and planctomycete cytochrome C domain-containing protein [Rubripirellula sp.]